MEAVPHLRRIEIPREKGRHTGERVLAGDRIGADDRHHPGASAVGRQFEAVLVGRVKGVIGPGVDLRLDRSAAPGHAVEKGFARRQRRPDG